MRTLGIVGGSAGVASSAKEPIERRNCLPGRTSLRDGSGDGWTLASAPAPAVGESAKGSFVSKCPTDYQRDGAAS